FTKYAVLFWTMCQVLRDTEMVDYFVWMHVLGCLLWGFIASDAPLVKGRLELAFGPGVDDSNAIAFHVLTAVAFAGLMFATYKGIKRWVAFATLPLLMNTVVLTGSRGALIGMAGAGAVVLFLAPKAHRVFIWSAALLGVILL